VIMAAVYMLYMFQKVFMGELDKEENKNLPQLAWQEVAVFVPLLILIFWIGLQPTGWFNVMATTTEQLVANMTPFIAPLVAIAP
jgi:NADH-quinone oxidoreductase subunit M